MLKNGEAQSKNLAVNAARFVESVYHSRTCSAKDLTDNLDFMRGELIVK